MLDRVLGLRAIHQYGSRHADARAKDEHRNGNEAADGRDEAGVPAVEGKSLRGARVLEPAGTGRRRHERGWLVQGSAAAAAAAPTGPSSLSLVVRFWASSSAMAA